MRVWRRLVVGVAAVAVAAVAQGCGEEDFPNDPRPPAPIDVSANVTDQRVVLSPDEIGAGTINIVASNQSQDEVRLTLDGPTLAASQSIPAGAVGQLKTIVEEGDYEITAGEESDSAPTKLIVGPQRASSQNDLLLP